LHRFEHDRHTSQFVIGTSAASLAAGVGIDPPELLTRDALDERADGPIVPRTHRQLVAPLDRCASWIANEVTVLAILANQDAASLLLGRDVASVRSVR
jgi:hypothetical protein